MPRKHATACRRGKSIELRLRLPSVTQLTEKYLDRITRIIRKQHR